MEFPAVIRSADIRKALNDFILQGGYDHVICLADSNTHNFCFPLLQYNCPVIIIPAGENHKTFAGAELVLTGMVQHGLSRRSLLINLGGGVVSDMGGFCASVYQRGIDYINIPTTLLAMVDASAGGKTGVDFRNLKNYVGTIYQPKCIISDTLFLKTLPRREYVSGWAEIIKHLLLFSRQAWETLLASEQGIDPADIGPVIEEALHLKMSVVKADPLDKSERRLLNFGHTLGHAIESYFLTQGNPVLHGEAIAAGMVCEAYISTKHRHLPQSDLQQIRHFISVHFPKLPLNAEAIDDICTLVQADKKNEHSTVRMVLLDETGKGAYNISVGTDVIRESLNYYSYE